MRYTSPSEREWFWSGFIYGFTAMGILACMAFLLYH